MAKTRQINQKAKQPPQWATNVKARIAAVEVLSDYEQTTLEEQMRFSEITRLYAEIGPGFSLKEARAAVTPEGWKNIFDVYAGFCARIEHLLIIMMQANGPVNEGVQITLQPENLPGVNDFECIINEIRWIYDEKHKHVTLEVYLVKGRIYEPCEKGEAGGYDLDNLPM